MIWNVDGTDEEFIFISFCIDCVVESEERERESLEDD